MRSCSNRNRLPREAVVPASVEHGMTADEVKQKKVISRKQDNVVKNEAYKDLLTIRQSNGGNSKYGDIQMIVKNYNNLGYGFVTVGVLNYMVAAQKKKELFPVEVVATTIRNDVLNESQTSSITAIETLVASDPITQNDSLEALDVSLETTSDNRCIQRNFHLGRTKGTAKKDQQALALARQAAIMEASESFKFFTQDRIESGKIPLSVVH